MQLDNLSEKPEVNVCVYCVCMRACVYVYQSVFLFWGIITSGAAIGASGGTRAATDRLTRKREVAVIGCSGPAVKHMQSEKQAKINNVRDSGNM